MKYIRICLVAVSLLLLVGIAAWYFVGWSINRAFSPAMKDGGGLRQLANVLEASMGSTLARGDVRMQAGETEGTGVLGAYQKNPEALQRDRKYFEAWHSALALADAMRKNEHLGPWESSAAIAWLSPSQRTDAWGHAFCVRSDQAQTIVLSPGPQALSSLDCNTLKVPEEGLARMPQGRLNPIDSGALILFVKKASDGSSATGVR
jgi:hypothetical protein